MRKLVDIINFNADASCLQSSDWLAALSGQRQSKLVRWLNHYVELERPVVLGLCGSAAADMVANNPESVALINRHPEIFQLIARPFSHDAALLRTTAGFRINLKLGLAALSETFDNVAPYYLPPEFMLTPEQVSILCDEGIALTFINANRYSADQQARIPDVPYAMHGPLGTRLACVPIEGSLTRAYLASLDAYDASPWNDAIGAQSAEVIHTWRDGETPFMFPNGIERERRWLEGACGFEPIHLQDHPLDDIPDAASFGARCFRSYPVHSLSAWMREFRMMGFVRRVWELEDRVHELNHVQTALWLQCINSDVLSAVEKDSVPKRYATLDEPDLSFDSVLHRSERGFEGWEFLLLLERLVEGRSTPYLDASSQPHMEKLRARIQYLQRHFNDRTVSHVLAA